MVIISKGDVLPSPLAEKKPERLVSNKANSLDMETYSWGQTLQEATINVLVPQGMKARSLVCEIKRNRIKVGLKNQAPIIEGEFFTSVMPDEYLWSLEDQGTISILLMKQDRLNWCKSLVKGGPKIDTQKVEPELSNLSDLDGETKTAVEKMMFNQWQKMNSSRYCSSNFF